VALTRSQNAKLHHLVEERAAELEEGIRNTLPKPADETTLERTGMAQDQVDDATTGAAEHLNHTMHNHYVDEMRQIEAARQRASSGLLDTCHDCGGEIGFQRLQAQPFAVRCLDCQERYERKIGALRR